MYEAVTRGIAVRVEPRFLPEQSDPGESRFVWAYAVRISNGSGATVTLVARHWRITDARGRTEEVHGPGVVGQQPTLAPGESFEYTSGCPLATPSGMMSGDYEMEGEAGERFLVAIPAFSLDSPHEVRVVQ